jgi:hypothetical protein
MSRWIFQILLLLFIVGCTFRQSALHIEAEQYEIVDYEDIDLFIVNFKNEKNVRISSPTLKVKLSGSPYDYIFENRYPDQFRCYVMSDNKVLSETEFGWLYYMDSKSKLNRITTYNEAKPKFSSFDAYMYRSLKANSEININNDINLLTSEFSHIKCNLVAVASIMGPLYISNDIIITREGLLAAYRKFLNTEKSHNVKKLSEYKH